MADSRTFSLTLELLEDYVFKVDFDEFGYILTDEAPPLGHGEGPNPALMVGAATANCLCASLLFALRKKKQNLPSIKAQVTGELERVEGFWRIGRISVSMDADTASVDHEVLEAALQKFEDFCIVTQSIRRGIPIHVTLKNASGDILLESD